MPDITTQRKNWVSICCFFFECGALGKCSCWQHQKSTVRISYHQLPIPNLPIEELKIKKKRPGLETHIERPKLVRLSSKGGIRNLNFEVACQKPWPIRQSYQDATVDIWEANSISLKIFLWNVYLGSNRYCLDKNYAGVLIIWDRLFGTFEWEREDEKIVYGLVDQPQFFNPLKHQVRFKNFSC